jgi:hypothetical protein
MKTSVTQKEKELFWIKSTINQENETEEDFIKASIKRAYRDFNRTLTGIGNYEQEQYNNLLEIIRGFVIQICNERTFQKQEDFDDWHKEKCNLLKEAINNELKYNNIHLGQCQKWINMTLKYLFLLGEDRIPGIEKNYQFFHIPIDSIIQEELFRKYKIEKKFPVWSKMDDYDSYLSYQKEIIEKTKSGEIPMDIEIKLFNKAKKKENK